MTTSVTSDDPTPAAERARTAVLAFGSPSTSRYVALLAALLSAGLFVGDWTYDQVLGRHWLKVVVDCAGQAMQATLQRRMPSQPAQAELALQVFQARCRGEAEIGRAIYALGGVGVAVATGLIILYLAPVIVRRRRRLRRLAPPLHEANRRFAELAASAGLRKAPRAERGMARQQDAFSYGAPGRPRVVLPPAVALRWHDPEVFDPVVLHELAHVRHRDVALAWLARSTWYAVAALLAVPAVITLLSSDRSILADFLWRAALLGLTVLLVTAALLRSREHDADLRAAANADTADALTSILRRLPEQVRRTRIGRLFARHPAPSQRILVLQNPERAARLTFVDGFTSAFLAALLLPLIVNVLVILYTGSNQTYLGELVAALVAGALLGGSVGLGLWRQALAGKFTGARTQVVRPAAGVACGLVLGQFASLASTGTGLTAGLHRPAWLLISAALGAGATAISAGMGQIWADGLAVLGRRWALALSVGIPGLTFAAALWLGTSLQFELDNRGVVFGRAWLVAAVPASGLVALSVAILVLSVGGALWIGRLGADPARRTDLADAPVSWPAPMRACRWIGTALTCGIVAEGSLVALRFVAGPAASYAGLTQRYYLYIWVAGAAAGACTVALCIQDRYRGPGLSCLAGPLATATAVGAFLVVNTALGGRLNVHFALSTARPPLTFGLVFCLLGALAALIPARSRAVQVAAPARRPLLGTLARYLTPAVTAAVISSMLVTSRGPVVGPPVTFASIDSHGSLATTPVRLAGLTYLAVRAPAIVAAYAPVKVSVVAAADASTRASAARVVQDRVLPLLRRVLRLAESIPLRTPQLAQIHYACLAAFRDAIARYSLLAQGLPSRNSGDFRKAAQIARASTAEWTRWKIGLIELVLGEGVPLKPSQFGLNSG